MRHLLVILVMAVTCSTAKAQSTFERIENIMEQQIASWNNGDLEGFMAAYYRSPELKFVSKKGVTMGWDQTLANYKKSYPDKAAMGKLTFVIHSHQKLSKKSVLTIGEWKLTYPDGSSVGGFYTLTWKKFGKDWKIIVDHTS